MSWHFARHLTCEQSQVTRSDKCIMRRLIIAPANRHWQKSRMPELVLPLLNVVSWKTTLLSKTIILVHVKDAHCWLHRLDCQGIDMCLLMRMPLQALTSLLAACASSAPQQALAAQLQTHLSSLAQASFNGIPTPQATSSAAHHRGQHRSIRPQHSRLPSLSESAQGQPGLPTRSQSWSPLDSDGIPGSGHGHLPTAPAGRASGSGDTSSLLPGGLGSFGNNFLTSRPGSASGEPARGVNWS